MQMQPMKRLLNWLEQNANKEHYLFLINDLRIICSELSEEAFRTLLSRVVKLGYLERVSRRLYAFKSSNYSNGLLLFHAAAYLRSNEFNYISLETVLSDAGVISQLPINSIFVMSSGRSNRISCGIFGIIEFIHTSQKPTEIMDELSYDSNCRMWRASVRQALRDMKKTQRNMDLIDWNIVNEFI